MTATATKAEGLLDLADAAREANNFLAKEDTFRVKAALMLRDLRRRVDDGEAGDIGWEKWCGKHIERSYRDIQKLLKLANDEKGPEKALERERSKARDGMHTTRASNVSRPLAEIKAAILKLNKDDLLALGLWFAKVAKRADKHQHTAPPPS
jgi:hypothetical protein